MAKTKEEDFFLIHVAVRKDCGLFKDDKFYPRYIDHWDIRHDEYIDCFDEIQHDTSERLITTDGKELNKDEYIYPYFMDYYAVGEWVLKLKQGVKRRKL